MYLLGEFDCHKRDKTVVGGKQGHAPCEISLLQKILTIVSIKCSGVNGAVTKLI